MTTEQRELGERVRAIKTEVMHEVMDIMWENRA